MAQRQITRTIEEPRLEDVSLEVVRREGGGVAVLVHFQIVDDAGQLFLADSIDVTAGLSAGALAGLRDFVTAQVLPALKQELVNRGKI